MGTDEPNIQGEGDHASARRYDEAAKRFVEQGRVGPAAERARTDDPSEIAELERAEQAGRARAREEDRLLDPRAGGPSPDAGAATPHARERGPDPRAGAPGGEPAAGGDERARPGSD